MLVDYENFRDQLFVHTSPSKILTQLTHSPQETSIYWTPHPPPQNPGTFTYVCFLPTPIVVAWVNRWTFSSPSPPPSPSHHQLFVSLRYRILFPHWPSYLLKVAVLDSQCAWPLTLNYEQRQNSSGNFLLFCAQTPEIQLCKVLSETPHTVPAVIGSHGLD